MTKDEAIENLSIALGISSGEVVRVIDNLNQKNMTDYERELMNDPKYTDYPDAVYLFKGTPFRVVMPPKPKEPRIKVSPYAKFDKLHKKKRK